MAGTNLMGTEHAKMMMILICSGYIKNVEYDLLSCLFTFIPGSKFRTLHHVKVKVKGKVVPVFFWLSTTP
jgi:hypothetical protein